MSAREAELYYNHWLGKLKQAYPMPWYFEQRNHAGVHLKDCNGNTVFTAWFDTESFRSLPPELRNEIVTRQVVLAEFLHAVADREGLKKV